MASKIPDIGTRIPKELCSFLSLPETPRLKNFTNKHPIEPNDKFATVAGSKRVYIQRFQENILNLRLNIKVLSNGVLLHSANELVRW